jgi:phosphoribosylanthranilate isomerase
MKPIAIKAIYEDCEEILALQKRTFQIEAVRYDDPTIPPMTQTLAELQADFLKKTILKIVLDNTIIGSVRAASEDGVVHIERLMVHQDYQKKGLGNILMEAIENHFAEAKMYKLYTGYKSFNNINWYQKMGYKIFGEDTVISPKLTITRLIKNGRNSLKIKVCGMRDAENIHQLFQLPIDYIGFIFYEKSARYVELIPDLSAIDGVISNHPVNTPHIKKVGVFVNANLDFLLEKVEKFGLNVVQLHGKETPQYIEELRIKNSKLRANDVEKVSKDSSFIIHHSSLNIEIWKVFSVDDSFDFKETKRFEGFVDKFLFDTKTPLHGGSGQKFDWNILNNYHGQTPFFLSGGISAADTEGVKNIQHPQFYGVDVNSKFEISPALKDVPMLKQFIKELDF